mgnify:CR=1 FL=1
MILRNIFVMFEGVKYALEIDAGGTLRNQIPQVVVCHETC